VLPPDSERSEEPAVWSSRRLQYERRSEPQPPLRFDRLPGFAHDRRGALEVLRASVPRVLFRHLRRQHLDLRDEPPVRSQQQLLCHGRGRLPAVPSGQSVRHHAGEPRLHRFHRLPGWAVDLLSARGSDRSALSRGKQLQLWLLRQLTELPRWAEQLLQSGGGVHRGEHLHRLERRVCLLDPVRRWRCRVTVLRALGPPEPGVWPSRRVRLGPVVRPGTRALP
jgi:hypothetical protein